jgi:hypothetical protein
MDRSADLAIVEKPIAYKEDFDEATGLPLVA